MVVLTLMTYSSTPITTLNFSKLGQNMTKSIVRNRNKCCGLRISRRNNRICVSGEQGLNQYFKDLTRFGVEPNPGPNFIIFSNFHLMEIENQLFEEFPAPRFKPNPVEYCILQSQELMLFSQSPSFTLSEESEYVVKLVENLLTLIRLLSKAETATDYSFAILVFAQCRSNKSISGLLMEKWNSIVMTHLQEDDGKTSFRKLRDIVDQYDSIKKLPIFTKLYRFLMYCIGTSLFEKMGVHFDTKKFLNLEKAAVKKEFHMGPDFIHCVLDTILYFAETGYECMVTGTISPFLHNETTYENWVKESEVLRVQAKYISNPEPHGFTVFDFLSRLDACIDKGKIIVKFLPKDASAIYMRKLVADLECIAAECKTKRLAQQERKAPFSVLIHGGSSVAKSQFTKMLFYHYGKLFNLPIDDEYKYTRNAFDQYWTNFNSSQWCLQLDDIAYLHPNSAQGCDPSLLEMLQVVNNVPYVPTQADLADKGKTPVRARFVIATTNTENLNAEQYFACPLAVQRRLPYIINLVPKQEYRRGNNPMIDPSKIPISREGEYPDLWNITVKRVVPKGSEVVSLHMGQTATYETVAIFDNIIEFLGWFNNVAAQAESIQGQAMKCDADMKSVVLCEHKFPSALCELCSTRLQSAEEAGMIITPWVTRFAEIHDQNEEEPGHRYTMNAIYQQISMMSILNRVIVMWYLLIMWFMKRFWFGPAVVAYFYGRWYWFIIASRLMHVPEMRHICCYLIGYRAYRVIRTPQAVRICAAIVAGVTVIKSLKFLIDADIFSFGFSKKKVHSEPSVIKFHNVKPHKYLCRGCEICNDWTVDEREARSLENGFECKGYDCARCDKLQGEAATRGVSPNSQNDKQENVWYKDSFECTTFDVSNATLSKNNWSLDDTIKFISRNLASYKLRVRDGDIIKEKRGRTTCIGGHIYLFNNHCVRYDCFELEVIFQSAKDGVTENFTTLVTSSQIKRFPNLDIAFITLPSIPPRKDIRDLFVKSSFRGRFDGEYVQRGLDGAIVRSAFKATTYENNIRFIDPSKDADISTTGWSGFVMEPNKDGDCGSILLVKSAFGPIILGIHALGGSNRSYAIAVTSDIIGSLDTHIISDSIPTLQVGDYKCDLVPLNRKATVRYIQEGTMITYGSLSGFRGAMKSRVGPTLMNEVAVRDGYQCNTGAPLMNSWVPWRRALLDMTRPVSHINLDILQHCVDMFTADILKQLTPQDLSEVVVYDMNTAVNGCPGLAYVDKMPRNTSAGFPFRKSKKYFLEAIPAFDDYQHPVKVTKEIEDEMDRIIVQYENSRAYCPVFVGSLKDEPTALVKIAAGKTRVFCGAPLPWSLVVRMYLLSTIRLIQKNRFIFEAGPGTIAQSTEWDDIYQYITQFGDDRIVAGDYGKFDKRMPASVILAAYDIIINILKAAGWTDSQLRVVRGIAEDTAFPTIDFNGDLIRCYGTNPSGHPLTVIINGLANSLYVRYCYTMNHPNHTCANFKENIALMTYGDDMIMGVNKQCTFLNHTIMQKTLADIDIEFTMAEKTAASIPFIHIDQATFLRRSWRFEPELGVRVCPIEHASIDKMLTMCVRSKTVSAEVQAVAVLDTATREYFWYGREVFEEKRKLFYRWIDELDLSMYLDRELPTWASLVDEFNKNSNLRN